MTEFVKPNGTHLRSIDECHKICYPCPKLRYCLTNRYCDKCYDK